MRKRTATAGVAVLLAGAAAAWPLVGGDEAPGSARAQQEAQEGQTAATADTLTPAERAIRQHREATRGRSQPLPFNHRFHVSEIQIECEYCHTGTEDQAMATMPSVELCMGCHQFVGGGLAPIDSLRGYFSRGEPIPWQRVYKVPEFVQFKHQAHMRNAIQCEDCHGPVGEMDKLYKAQRLTMGWCLECHRQEPQPGDVATTAKLIEQADVPETPEGRQPIGLYPRAISSGYGAQRAPDDCATCHY